VVFDSILNKPPAPINTVDPKLPPQLQKIVSKSLHKNRHDRYQSCAEIRDSLKVLRGATTKMAALAPSSEPASGNTLKAALAVAVVAVIAVLGFVWWRSRAPEQQQASTTTTPAVTTTTPAVTVPAASPVEKPTAPTEKPAASAPKEKVAEATAHAVPAPKTVAREAAPAPTPPPQETEETGPGGLRGRRGALRAERLTGQFSGGLRNVSLGVQAAATLSIAEEKGLINGCLQVSPPLGGSGPVRGIVGRGEMLLNTSYRGGRMEFRAHFVPGSPGEMRGSYTVFQSNGRVENGMFQFTKSDVEPSASSLDPRSCSQ
jgi:hypothetical protein